LTPVLLQKKLEDRNVCESSEGPLSFQRSPERYLTINTNFEEHAVLASSKELTKNNRP